MRKGIANVGCDCGNGGQVSQKLSLQGGSLSDISCPVIGRTRVGSVADGGVRTHNLPKIKNQYSKVSIKSPNWMD